MSRNAYFRFCIGLSVVAVFLFGVYSIQGRLASSAKNVVLQNPLQEKARDAYEHFKSQSAESMSLLKDVLQKQAENIPPVTPTATSAEP